LIHIYIYIERDARITKHKYWSNLVFKENEYIPDITQPMVSMEYKWKALLAIYSGLEKFNEILDTGEKIKYIIG